MPASRSSFGKTPVESHGGPRRPHGSPLRMLGLAFLVIVGSSGACLGLLYLLAAPTPPVKRPDDWGARADALLKAPPAPDAVDELFGPAPAGAQAQLERYLAQPPEASGAPPRPRTEGEKLLAEAKEEIKPRQTAELTPREVNKKAARSVLVIRARTPPGAPDHLGSGFVLRRQRVVVTNAHVIDGAAGVDMKDSGGREIGVNYVLGVNERLDLAVLPLPDQFKDIEGLDLAGELPEIGDKVFALGSPQGFEFSFTEGIVSQIRGGGGAEGRWIQTQTPISPGSSGGPLLNSRCEVVGVNTLGSVATPGGGAQNLNFARSASDVLRVCEGLHNQSLVDLPGYKALVGRLRGDRERAAAEQEAPKRKEASQQEFDDKTRADQEFTNQKRAEYEQLATRVTDQWRRLSRGMTRTQVQGLLGAPERVSAGVNIETWYYVWHVTNYPIGPDHPIPGVRTGNVTFGRDGRVIAWDEPQWYFPPGRR